MSKSPKINIYKQRFEALKPYVKFPKTYLANPKLKRLITFNWNKYQNLIRQVKRGEKIFVKSKSKAGFASTNKGSFVPRAGTIGKQQVKITKRVTTEKFETRAYKIIRKRIKIKPISDFKKLWEKAHNLKHKYTPKGFKKDITIKFGIGQKIIGTITDDLNYDDVDTLPMDGGENAIASDLIVYEYETRR